MANNQSSNEQWKTNGECSICRRQSYCKKRCSANKKSIQRAVGRAFASTRMGSVMLAVNAMTRGDYNNRKYEKGGEND